MKYNQPYGVTDPNAGYVNGNPSSGIQGSIPPAEAIEYTQREIVAAIAAAGLTPGNDDLVQLARAMQIQASNAATDSGAANTIVVALTPAPLAYTFGLTLRVKIANNVTGATTINVNGLGAKAVVRPGNNPLASGDCAAGDILEVVYDGTRFQLVSIFAGIGSGGAPTLSPGDSVIVDPVTALLEQARKKVAVAGTNRTFVAGDRGKLVYRTNGGSAMVDTLPSSGLTAGWVTTVKNGHAAGQGALTINLAGGLLIDGAASFLVNPGASVTISYDGTGFISMNETVVTKTFGGMSNGNVITAFTVRTDIGIFAVCNGSVSALAQNVSAHVTLPFSYGTASYTISHMIVGAAMSGPAAISGNKSTSGFDIQNLSPQAGNINVEWHTVGAL